MKRLVDILYAEHKRPQKNEMFFVWVFHSKFQFNLYRRAATVVAVDFKLVFIQPDKRQWFGFLLEFIAKH